MESRPRLAALASRRRPCPEALEPRAMLTGITGVGATLVVPTGENYAGIVARFAVPGADLAKTPYAATIDWGDGQHGPGFVSQPGGPGTPIVVVDDGDSGVGEVGGVVPLGGEPVTPGHTYETPGNYPLNVSLRPIAAGGVAGAAIATAAGSVVATLPPPLIGTDNGEAASQPLVGLKVAA